uniref:Uncharacterized protein n=1 Tax=Solanum tuberosum TaxID=4113 RepID=M1DTP1_SOLTU
MSQLAALVYSNPKEELMDHMNVDAMNATQTSTVVTRSGKILQNALIIEPPQQVEALLSKDDESDPQVTKVHGNGEIETEDIKGVKFKVNGQCLKVLFGENGDVRVIEMVYLDNACETCARYVVT